MGRFLGEGRGTLRAGCTRQRLRVTGDKSISNAESPVSAIVGRRCEPGLENPHRAIEEPDQQSGRRRAPWGTGGSIRCCAFGAPSGGPSDDGRRGSCGIVPGESVPAVSSRWFEARAAVRTCRASRLEHHAHPHLVRARRDEMRAAERRQEVLSGFFVRRGSTTMNRTRILALSTCNRLSTPRPRSNR
jgi:hypothetical protein